jgi:hypothetical protein
VLPLEAVTENAALPDNGTVKLEGWAVMMGGGLCKTGAKNQQVGEQQADSRLHQPPIAKWAVSEKNHKSNKSRFRATA